jgi:hypothetical protein
MKMTKKQIMVKLAIKKATFRLSKSKRKKRKTCAKLYKLKPPDSKRVPSNAKSNSKMIK